ncbi:NAD(P)(+) transhydrogenase (Re/Si-specific) subunit beta [Aureliella helgolandensis]|uniref:NAD(P) transhydrogenase subunit beta n=1 Tax=Aureliella helgolandensis TaxID=2527968 RepID=A0A518G8G2_9BACT|nr:NAD(P)(+) transhydrogenase (Re/Si-specific) subunit beta [Aureliella helgolandensis]QDV24876.1 NAD(P) transhydrogenase subunit beta [Aureliella helgolandensis]
MTGSAPLLLAYLASSLLFILGLKQMSHPRSAVRGIVIASMGMLVAIVATLLDPQVAGYTYIVVGLIVGSALGAYLALSVEMTSMPQMVGLLNALGGGASTLVAWADLELSQNQTVDTLIAVGLSGLIGTVTFWGSLVAYAKLEEFKKFKKPFSLPMQPVINGALLLLALVFIGMLATADAGTGQTTSYVLILVVASVLGLFLVLPIGGADMPVVVSLMNSYSGLAGAATGFVIDNNALIIAGSLVGASGVILTQIMCKAMNRSLVNVLFGKMAGGSSGGDTDEVYANVRSTSADDVAMILDGAQRVVFVPGYGMAVAQAQHAVRDLSKLLEANGATVEYAIHPVAGRMPGHMNVLLAEADISYDKLKEMDEINPTLDSVDVAIVIGANDVVNPVAKTDPNSPIAGMPIIEVDKCRTVIVIKRSLSPGFAGIPNPLFALPNTLMLFADGQQAVMDITKAIKEL